jgi:hypothetical protein
MPIAIKYDQEFVQLFVCGLADKLLRRDLVPGHMGDIDLILLLTAVN